MKKFLPLPSKELLEERLTYDPISGNLFWKDTDRKHFNSDEGWRRFNEKRPRTVAGHKHKQKNGAPHAIVVRISLDGKDMWLLAHRIIFVLMGVPIPEGAVVDHINRNPWDNRWENLRLCSESQNAANSWHDENKRSLPKGVSLQAGRYKAQISVGRKKRHIGMYATPEEASRAYRLEAEKAFGGFVYFGAAI